MFFLTTIKVVCILFHILPLIPVPKEDDIKAVTAEHHKREEVEVCNEVKYWIYSQIDYMMSTNTLSHKRDMRCNLSINTILKNKLRTNF